MCTAKGDLREILNPVEEDILTNLSKINGGIFGELVHVASSRSKCKGFVNEVVFEEGNKSLDENLTFPKSGRTRLDQRNAKRQVSYRASCRA